MNAIRDANPAITITRQCQTRMFFKRGVNALENIGMTEIVLRHGFVPHEDTRDQWPGSDAQCELQFFLCQLEQFIFIPGDILPGAPNEHTDQGVTFRRAVREFGGGPGAGEGAASLAAGNDITISIQVAGHIALTIGEGNSGCRGIGNALQIGSQPRPQSRQNEAESAQPIDFAGSSNLLPVGMIEILQSLGIIAPGIGSSGEAKEVVETVAASAEVVVPRPLPAPACRDPDDDMVLATALAAKATAIVSGDQDLLVPGRFRDIPILTPRGCLVLVRKSGY